MSMRNKSVPKLARTFANFSFQSLSVQRITSPRLKLREMLSYFDSSGQACCYAVVIAQGRAHDRGHTSSVYCLEINGFGVEEQIHGNPFRLRDCNRFLWDNEDLRTKEINIGSIVFVDRFGSFLGSTGLKMVIS